MSEPLGIGMPLAPGGAMIPPAPSAPQVELLTPPPAVQAATNFAAIVVGRSAEGALMLRSAFGMLSMKTALTLATGSRIELRLQPGNPPSVIMLAVAPSEESEPAAPPPTQLDLGTTVAATVIAAPADADGPPEGTHLMLRVIVPAPASSAQNTPMLAGEIAVGGPGETVVETPIGTLALETSLALPPGTAIAFERLEETRPVPTAAPPPSQASGWPALDQALAVLDQGAPDLAQLMRSALAPRAAPALAGSLLFLMGALYGGRWPIDAVAKALTAAGQERLRARLGDDVAALGRLSGDAATGAWQVLVLPLMAGTTVQPLRLYLRRRGGQADRMPGDGARFVIEVELSRLGALQLDGLVRGQRLDVVLRSHRALAPDVRAEARAIFRRASDASGFYGDIVFTTTAQFAIAPLAGLRRRIELRA